MGRWCWSCSTGPSCGGGGRRGRRRTGAGGQLQGDRSPVTDGHAHGQDPGGLALHLKKHGAVRPGGQRVGVVDLPQGAVGEGDADADFRQVADDPVCSDRGFGDLHRQVGGLVDDGGAGRDAGGHVGSTKCRELDCQRVQLGAAQEEDLRGGDRQAGLLPGPDAVAPAEDGADGPAAVGRGGGGGGGHLVTDQPVGLNGGAGDRSGRAQDGAVEGGPPGPNGQRGRRRHCARHAAFVDRGQVGRKRRLRRHRGRGDRRRVGDSQGLHPTTGQGEAEPGGGDGPPGRPHPASSCTSTSGPSGPARKAAATSTPRRT